MKKILFFTVCFFILVAFAGQQIKKVQIQREESRREKQGEKTVVKIGYFPNITHSQALVGMVNNTFQETLGSNVTIEKKIFNAGPSEIEALFAGEIDLGYIGPSPAINGYLKSKGESLRIISGSASGGASLVVQPSLFDQYQKQGTRVLKNKKIASPQQGNTQDVSLRHFLKENGLDQQVQVVPIANADQLTMFAQKQIDGAWAPEPWASRLVQEAGGKRLIDERDLWPKNNFCTTNIIVSKKFLDEHSDLVKKWLEAQIKVTEWINQNSEESQKIVNGEIEKLTGKKLADAVLTEAWTKLTFTVDPLKDSVMTFSNWAFTQGFLGETTPDLSNLYDLTLLNEITAQSY